MMVGSITIGVNYPAVYPFFRWIIDYGLICSMHMSDPGSDVISQAIIRWIWRANLPQTLEDCECSSLTGSKFGLFCCSSLPFNKVVDKMQASGKSDRDGWKTELPRKGLRFGVLDLLKIEKQKDVAWQGKCSGTVYLQMCDYYPFNEPGKQVRNAIRIINTSKSYTAFKVELCGRTNNFSLLLSSC